LSFSSRLSLDEHVLVLNWNVRIGRQYQNRSVWCCNRPKEVTTKPSMDEFFARRRDLVIRNMYLLDEAPLYGSGKRVNGRQFMQCRI